MEQYKTIEIEVKVKDYELPQYFIVIPLTKEEFDIETKKISDANCVNNEKKMLVFREYPISVQDRMEKLYERKHQEQVLEQPIIQPEAEIIEQYEPVEQLEVDKFVEQSKSEPIIQSKVTEKGYIKRKSNFFERLAGK